MTQPANEPNFAEYINSELGRRFAFDTAAVPCPLCGQALGGHDQAVCDAKMAAWKPTGFLDEVDLIKTLGSTSPPPHVPTLLDVRKVVAYIPISHDDVVDSDPSHICGPDCPPEPPPPPPLPRSTRVRYALRRARWQVARLGGLRLVHKDRIDQDRDD